MSFMRRVIYSALIPLIFMACLERRYPGPLTPEAALQSFHLDSNFSIELYAAEPFVKDPVSMAFDEAGNVYVVEMHDYPFAPEPGHEQGRIKVLIDANKDGRIDSSIVFADSLSEATTVLPWKGGLIVTAAPQIWYFKDTTGDFKADVKQILYKGFFKGNSEGQITALRYSIDNWIYAANLGFESHVTSTTKKDTGALSLVGTDFRFRMDRDEYEPAAGAAQFGQAIDNWGHRFITENSLHIQEVAFPWRYHHRNPYLKSGDDVADISDHQQDNFQLTPPPYWRAERTKRRNEQYQQQHLDRVEYADKHFTGAAGGVLYYGDQFPDDCYGNYFTGDVACNLVHRDRLVQSDSSPVYIASLAGGETNHEFLASTDPWFRPVNTFVGPDGFLYVIDMYRQHIETPFAIPEDLKKDMDFMNGSEYGRIYRIVPKGKTGKGANIPDTRHFNTADWVSLLQHPSQSWRLQAQRKLIELQDPSAVPALLDLFQHSKDAKVRLHAFFAIEGLNALKPALVQAALSDPEAGVREAALPVAEQFPQLQPEIIRRMSDSSIRVSYQATLSAGSFTGKEIAPALEKILKAHVRDKWFRKAVLSSSAGSSLAFVEGLAKDPEFFNSQEQGKLDFVQDISYIIAGRNNKDEIKGLLVFFSRPGTDKKWLESVLSGIQQKAGNTDDQQSNATLLSVLKEVQKSDPSAPVQSTITAIEKDSAQ